MLLSTAGYLYPSVESLGCGITMYMDIHDKRFLIPVSQNMVACLFPAFDQTGGVLELQSRVANSLLTGKLYAVALEFLALQDLYGRNNFTEPKHEIIL